MTIDAAGDSAAANAASQRTRLSVLLALNVAMIAGLLVVGLLTHSLGVLAAGGDYVVDSSAILLGIIAVGIRDRVGHHSKAPAAVAALNAGALLVVMVFVISAAVRRLVHGAPHVHGLPVLIVSAVATAVMVVGVLVLGVEAGKEDLHMRSVLLDTVADAVASASVAVTGAVIYLSGGYYWLDSAVAVVIGVVIGWEAIRLLRDVFAALRVESGRPDPQDRK